jgi:glycosylphosphatidylinositol deacylase
MQQQWTIWLWALVSLLFAYVSYNAAVYTGDVVSPQGCRMSYMYPEYILQPGFNTSWTPLANRYSLWLYREGDGWDSHRKVNTFSLLLL